LSASRPVGREFFDDLFRAYEKSPGVRALMRTALDERLPPEVEPYSFITLHTLETLAKQLRLTADSLLVDLACGRGGPGMWITRATGARLIGVDLSAVAVRQARSRTAAFGLQGRAEFRIGELWATGVADAQADALMCLDSVHFAADRGLVAREVCRILRPGGTFVSLGWEPRDAGDNRMPEPLAGLDLGREFRAAGFAEVTVVELPDLQERAEGLFRRVTRIDPGDDSALVQLRAEAAVVLPLMPLLRRVHITAIRPR
jgi:SAM-dependent methyltransferase